MIRICEIDIRNPKYTTFTKLVQVRNFITFELMAIRHKERERETHTIFLCWLLLHRQLSTQPAHGVRSAQIQLWISTLSFGGRNSTNCFFSNPKILSPRFRCVTSLTSPGPNFYLGFLFWHLWMTHPLRARVNTCVNVAPN